MMQKLFDHMEQTHGLILTQSELQDIVSAVGCDVRLLLDRAITERDDALSRLADAAKNAARYRYVRRHMMRRNAWEQTSDPDLFDERVDMGIAAEARRSGA